MKTRYLALLSLTFAMTSSVAFALATRALGEDRVRGVYVDTGLMREGETDFVRRIPGIAVENAQAQFLGALTGVTEPEQKRHIIGEEFVRVNVQVGFQQGLDAPALGAKDVADALDRDHHIGVRRNLARPRSGWSIGSQSGCRGWTRHHAPFGSLACPIRQC